MSEILKVKVSDSHTLIAYEKSQSIPGQGGRPSGRSIHELAFKVGPTTGGTFIEASPEAASALLAMFALQRASTASLPNLEQAEAHDAASST